MLKFNLENLEVTSFMISYVYFSLKIFVVPISVDLCKHGGLYLVRNNFQSSPIDSAQSLVLSPILLRPVRSLSAQNNFYVLPPEFDDEQLSRQKVLVPHPSPRPLTTSKGTYLFYLLIYHLYESLNCFESFV